MEELISLVLAAGKGTRMKSALPKAAHRLCGRPLAGYAVELARAMGSRRTVVIVGHGAEQVRAALGDGVEYVIQEPQLGTGHAVQQAARGQLADLRDIGGIDEEFHARSSCHPSLPICARGRYCRGPGGRAAAAQRAQR